ncbi:serine/threonine protein kinase, partial [Streptomyces anulatus]
VHAATTPGGVTALDPRSGRIRWSRTDLGRLASDDDSADDGPPLVADGTLYATGPEPGREEKSWRDAFWGVHALDALRERRLWWGAREGGGGPPGARRRGGPHHRELAALAIEHRHSDPGSA